MFCYCFRTKFLAFLKQTYKTVQMLLKSFPKKKFANTKTKSNFLQNFRENRKKENFRPQTKVPKHPYVGACTPIKSFSEWLATTVAHNGR